MPPFLLVHSDVCFLFLLSKFGLLIKDWLLEDNASIVNQTLSALGFPGGKCIVGVTSLLYKCSRPMKDKHSTTQRDNQYKSLFVTCKYKKETRSIGPARRQRV